MPEKSVIFASTVKNYYETKKNEFVLKKRENGVFYLYQTKQIASEKGGRRLYEKICYVCIALAIAIVKENCYSHCYS